MKKILRSAMMACTFMVAANAAWSQTQQPYSGTPISLPGTIEAERFDLGGLGTAYYDVTTNNTGGAPFRTNESVDIEVSSAGGYNVTKIETYEWLEYTVNVAQSGNYKFDFRVASTNSAGKIDLTIDGNSIGSVNVPKTGSMQIWRTARHTYGGFGQQLTAGVHVLRLSFSNTLTHYDMFNLDKVIVSTATTLPFSNLTIPGTIEAEHYDIGGYYDITAGNAGGYNRTAGGISLTENVDMEPSSEGGLNVGWIQAGEWLDYTVHVKQEDLYSFDARIASSTSMGAFQLAIDGSNITNVISVPYTGGWQNWQNVSMSNIPLAAGTHILRIKMIGSEFNLNKLTFTKTVATAGCTGIFNKDYAYVLSTPGSNPTITFNPILNGVGANGVTLYYGTSGTLPGFAITPGVAYQINASLGQFVKFYFIYSVPTGGTRSSSATPHGAFIGTCSNSSAREDINESASIEANTAVYPNPMGESNELYFAETGKTVSVKVLNAAGSVLLEKKEWNTTSPLDLTALSNGIFYVSTNDGSELKTYKIVR